MAFTPQQIEEAEQRLLKNILRVREGDTWVEYGSARELRQAIEYAKAQSSQNAAPRGTRLIQISSGY